MRLSAFILFLTFSLSGITQDVETYLDDEQVIHLSGTQEVAGFKVTVQAKGYAGTYEYCENTGPYYIGHDWELDLSKTGSFLFTFDPPVEQVRLNFSGISWQKRHKEEVQIHINGKHYPLTSMGYPNGCDDMAWLNKKGNIEVPKGVKLGGWSGTVIQEDIYSLEVVNHILKGHPRGSLFSLFIGGDPHRTVYSEEDKKRMREAGYIR